MQILSLGEKIKKLRKEQNMTLKELAGDRITAAQISHIERDKSHTSQELLEYLADKLGVSVDYLLETKEMQSKKITDNLILKSEIYIKCDELEEAEEQINEIIKVCKNYKLTENYGKCNNLLAEIYCKRGDYSSAVYYYEKALYYFIKNEDKEDIYNCYVSIGDIYGLDKFHKGALTHYMFAKEVLEESNIEDGDIYKELYSKISKSYMNLKQPQKALEFMEKIDRIDNEDNVKEEVNILVMKAKGLLSVGKYVESKECFNKALEIIKKEENKNRLAQVYLTMSNIYSEIGDVDKHLEYSQKVYDITKRDENKYMMESLFNMIESYVQKGEYEMAKKYCKLALVSSIKNKDKYYEYKSLKFYSDMYKNQDEVETAIDYLNKCITIANNLQDSKILANLYIELGKLYSNISKDKELEYYQKGVLMYKDLNII
ncbi:MAG: helix-turn-helix domain-containing protein [Clostridiales bacterium]|uniref:helix-turn-helix domain-containing protein n=1 Tax=Terrisporobacter sp. TaxID=1965305 RepID=UPI002A48A2B1|nr:helix-turn-helix domain-containing protein [Terrisporobacter sp.]MCI5629377.1 helix-turn-helix domain-containing protein [Clostridium sp.]MDD5879816.1 helix-turn-helix domain-containing protein [Clostridiales bacterium]MCI6458920.1 helix-turn-helix domain-containing protein [Clostridium sp.]MCI7205359.1 helix-turn-helix domain-containing protein [Clostridium sp.]MDD7755390.1 helix-turn-helix domain-containing protein [Clostridiales bacterium]